MRYFGWLIAGFAFYKLSGVLEAMGDAAPYAADGGVAYERLQYHGTALALLVAGGACFVRAGILIWKSVRGGGSPKPDKPAKAEAPVEAEPAFDPDAALARYLANRDGGDTPRPTSPTGFGRRGL
jgi:hypothetical protein